MAEAEATALGSEDLGPVLARLDGWLSGLGTGLASARLSIAASREDSEIARRIAATNAAVDACVSNEPRQRDALRPVEALARSLDQAVVLLVFGKFNAGKSSLCNLMADRFAAHGAEVAFFQLDADGRLEPCARFTEGATETTSRIQGIRLGQRLVLLDTPGLHSATGEHAALTRRFSDCADAVLWLTSSSTPGQVQELDELAGELRRGKPLLPVITRSDRYEEDEIDGALVKLMRNKPMADRSGQEADVAERARDKLAALGLDVAQLRPPVSVSVHMARAEGESPAAMAAAGMDRLYAALRALVSPALAYRRRKPAEVRLRHLDETVLSGLQALLRPALEQLKAALNDVAGQLEHRSAQVQEDVWRAVVPRLPDLLDAHAPERDAAGVRRNVSRALQSAWAEARDAHFRDYRLGRDAQPAPFEAATDIGFDEIMIEVDGGLQSAGVDATRLHAALERQIGDWGAVAADHIREECAAALREVMAGAAHLDAVLRAHEASLREIRSDLRAPA
ncbi:50S ribosome-binding GTPase [Xanthobacter autotrophicus]|uniref:GTPase n=1 Tax=Xanthobacter autotrophicus TaxID=280 RepID=UPI001E3B2D6A|nr:GTPase [Xanthobacter autotrophicus]UDQ87910.1 50S ribosome-binding GTPase [Xanthobacter autotrophicus]